MSRGFVYSCKNEVVNVVASINALRHYGHTEPVSVYDLGMPPKHRAVLASSVNMLDLPPDVKPESSRPYIMSTKLYDQTIFLDNDVLPLSNLDDLFKAAEDGMVVGVKEGDGTFYGADHRKHGFAEDFFNNKYVSLALMAIDMNRHEKMLTKWRDECRKMTVDNPTTWAEFEQDIFNVVLCSSGVYDQIMPLDYNVWYNKWSFVSNMPVIVDHKNIVMATPTGDVARCMHVNYYKQDRVEMLHKIGIFDPLFAYLKFLYNGPLVTTMVPIHLKVFQHKHRDQIDLLGTNAKKTKSVRPEELAMQTTTSDDVVMVFNDLSAKFREGTIILKFDDPFRAFELLQKMRFSDVYVFGLDLSKDQREAHRLTVALMDLGEKKRKVHICHDGDIPLEWQNFFTIASHVSTSEGLKQAT